MKTSLIEDKKVSKFDKRLLKVLPSHIFSAGVHDSIIIGVENERGEIYRIIETDDSDANGKLVDELQSRGYVVDVLESANEHGLRAVVKYLDERV